MYGACKVKNLKTTELLNGYIQIHELSINDSEEPHIRISMTKWKDHDGISPALLASLVVLVMSLSKDGIIAVNCRGGIGRTGTFIVASELLRAALAGKILPEVHDLIAHLRMQRGNDAVQTAVQYSTLKETRKHAAELAAAFRPLLAD